MSPLARPLRTVLALAAAVPALAAPPPSAGDAVDALRTWIARRGRTDAVLDAEGERELRSRLADLRALREGEPARAREVDLALLELAVSDWTPAAVREARDPGPGSRRGLACRLALDRLERRLEADPAVAGWLATDVLGAPSEHAPALRAAAAELLRGRHDEALLPALLAAARDPDRAVRAAAVEALVGWRHHDVHHLVLDLLERDRIPTRLAGRHLAAARDELGPGARDRLRRRVGGLYLSSDWREAARAGALVAGLPAEDAVPLLVEALETWLRREEAGEGSRRVVGEVVAELERISGRTIGPRPEAWRTWWAAVREGRIETVEDVERRGEAVSAAAFFGVRPVSDRLVFVLDRSGSMAAPFGTAGRTRYEEAVEQALACLEGLGSETRFGVTLFDSDARSWKRGLVEATPRNLGRLRRWLERQRPDGGTRLREGLREALSLGRDGAADPRRIEADTAVVLCDGETAEGPGWVRPWLERENEAAQVRFHCVQIGPLGDGALEELAAGSGGDHVRVRR